MIRWRFFHPMQCSSMICAAQDRAPHLKGRPGRQGPSPFPFAEGGGGGGAGGSERGGGRVEKDEVEEEGVDTGLWVLVSLGCSVCRCIRKAGMFLLTGSWWR